MMHSLRTRTLFAITLLLFSNCVLTCSCHAQSAIAIRELAEFVFKKFSKELGEESIETIAKQIDNVVARGGQQAIEAIQKVGPRAFHWIDDAAVDAPMAARLIAKYGEQAEWVVTNPVRRSFASQFGDDAALAMIRHGAPAEQVLEVGGRSAANALANLSPRFGRQLAMLCDESATRKLVQNESVQGLIGKSGDRAMAFVWKNKGALLVTATLTAFLADPDPFIDGTKDLAQIAATNAVHPIANRVASGTNWTLTLIVLSFLLTTYMGIRFWISRPVKRAI